MKIILSMFISKHTKIVDTLKYLLKDQFSSFPYKRKRGQSRFLEEFLKIEKCLRNSNLL